jgi:hypothetical protein
VEKYGISFWIAQFLSMVSLGFFVFSWSQKLRENTLKFQVFGNVLNILIFFILGAYTGMLMSFINLLRNFIYRLKGKREWIEHPLLMYSFMVALVAGSLFSWKGLMTLFPCIACILGTYSISRENTIEMKYFMLAACVLWIPYNIWVEAYVGAFGTVVLCVSIWIFILKEKERNKVNKVAD